MTKIVSINFTRNGAEKLMNLLDRVSGDFEYYDEKEFIEDISSDIYINLVESKWLN